MVISFSKLGTHGRLGNCLFQIAGTLGMAEKYNAEAVFPEWKDEQAFETLLPHGPMQTNQIKETYFHHYDWQLKESCDLFGYLQSYKYFPKELPFKFNRDFINKAKQGLEAVFEKPTISIHIRRTDYVNNPLYYQLHINWFIRALFSIDNWQEHNIIIFSDDIGYAKIHFECLSNVFFSEHKTPMQDVCLMSLCDNHILSNSSISWWGAYLSKQKNILHPRELFAGNFKSKSLKDYWPDNWKEFWPDNLKIDLRDCTFTIPVYMDHLDRKKNLELSLCMIQQAFDTNVIIGEQGKKAFSYTAKYALRYVYFDYKHFHRTKMLNEMAMLSKTNIVANWDADIILPPLQIWMACEMLKNGSDMVFPYDGRFARMNRMMWFPKIEKSLDIGTLGDAKLSGKRGREIPENSVGGAVFFNKESFIEGGMENENMISFGPEDCERNDRFKALGFKVDRTGGCLYHMDHWCGANSNTLNPFFKANHVELEKVRAMLLYPEQLKAYVKTWAWYHKYTGDYYGRISEGAIQSAKEVYKVLKGLKIVPKTVIDVGGGVGEWNNGIAGYVCLDYNVPKRRLLVKPEQYVNVDLEKVEYFYDSKYDLALCLEVAEHLTPERAEPLINMLCGLSDKVLFSAAIPYQGGHGHLNEAWQSYWGNLFAKHDFFPSHNLRELLFDNDKVDLYYRQNIVLYEKGAKGKVVDFVHPKYYIEIVKHLTNTLKALQV